MGESNKDGIVKIFKSLMPDFFRLMAKRLYYSTTRKFDKMLYIKKERRVELGPRFRFSREKPYLAYIGEKTVTDEFNIWNVYQGDIIVGKNCWFGLHNIVMGPTKIGDRVATGPFVSILGPRHAVLDSQSNKKDKTIIGNNVWISTGSIISFGVEIGDNAIIGPGSVVTKDVPTRGFVAGNPARDLSRLAEKSWKVDTISQARFQKI